MKRDISILEKGDIYFFYRPKVNIDSPKNLSQIERFYILLKPNTGKDQNIFRLIVIGHKVMPPINHTENGDFWGFVDKIFTSQTDLDRELGGKRYYTQTKGQEQKEEARLAGDGVYDILCHEDHTHLVYMLKVPKKLAKVQNLFNISEQGSYIFSIKNPNQPSSQGLSTEEEAHYPPYLQEKFQHHKWLPVDPVKFLDFSGTQILLIGARKDVLEELGVNLNPQKEQEVKNAAIKELHLTNDQSPHQFQL